MRGAFVCLLLVLVVAVGGTACGARQRPAMVGEIKAVTITITGNAKVSDSALTRGLMLTSLRENAQPYDDYLVVADADRMRGYYYRHGFFKAQVRWDIERKGAHIFVRYTVDEGPKSPLLRVELAGLPDDPAIAPTELRDLIPIDDGAALDYDLYELSKPALIEKLAQWGYPHARLDAKVVADRVRNETIIRLEYTPGPACTFGAVTIEGISGELLEAARARLSARTGERYSSAKLADSQAALYDLGRFSSVRVAPQLTADNTEIPIKISLIESTRHELRLGGGLGANNTAFEVRGKAAYQVAGWPRPLINSGAELRLAYQYVRADGSFRPRVEALTSMEKIDLFRPYLRGRVEAAFSYQTVEAYTSVGPRLRLSARAPLYRKLAGVVAGWQMSLLEFTDIDEAVDAATQQALGLTGAYRLAAFDQSVFFDLRDDPVATRLGLYATLRLDEGGVFAGGNISYVKLVSELRAYLPVGPFVLATRGRFGTFVGDVPVTERFYAGGASSQRGFAERQLAPSASAVVDDRTERVVIGGSTLAELGGELRVALGTLLGLPIGGVWFLDGGDVTETVAAMQLARLHWATGPGVRVATPVGPVRIDVGFRINRTGAGEPSPSDTWAVHLSLGEAF